MIWSGIKLTSKNQLFSCILQQPSRRYKEKCRGLAPAGSRGTLRMNGIGERETRRTGLDRAKSARERERKKERDQTRNMQQSLAVVLFFTIAFIP